MIRAILGFFLIPLAVFVSPAMAAELLPLSKPIEEAIDHYIDAKLSTSKIEGAEQTDDANLIRRLTLDLAGRIPAAVEVREYLDSDEGDKRGKAIDQLLASPEFYDHMANQFNVMLMANVKGSVRDYLKAAFQETRAWDQICLLYTSPRPRD